MHCLFVGQRRVVMPFPILAHNRRSSESSPGTVTMVTPDCPEVAGTTLVPTTSGDADGRSTPPSEEPPLAAESTRRSPSSGRPASSVRMAGIRDRLLATGLSSEACNLLQASWRTGTNKIYNSAWKRWKSWCRWRNTDPFNSDVTNVANFLAEEFTQGKAYRTLNVYRSAISSTHTPVNNQPLEEHPVVRRIMKGSYISRPPQPCYSGSWDVGIVVDLLRSWPENDRLSRKQLSQKLTILLALTTASRASELAALDTRFITVLDSSVMFHLPSLTKTHRVGQSPWSIVAAAFPQESKLCVREVLLAYLSSTKSHRSSGDQALLIYRCSI